MNKEIESLFADMGKTWDHLVADPQLRWYAFVPRLSVALFLYVVLHADIALLLGSAQRRALFILQRLPWTMPFGICMQGPVGSLSGSFWST